MYDITLIFPNSPFLISETVFPPLGIMYLSAFLKKHGVSVQCLDLSLGHSLLDIKSKVVGISITTPQRDEAFKIVHELKDKGYFLIAGGPHANHMSAECYRHGFHKVIGGFAYEALLEYLKPEAKVKINSADDIPYPDRDALPIHDYKYFIRKHPATTIMTSFGCPYSCSFCAKISNKFSLQSVERTVSEIHHINEKYGFKAFMIFDDVFVSDKKRLKAIANELDGCGYLFRCFVRANLITEAVCEHLSQMGVVEVGIGIESGSDEVLKRNFKGTTREINTKAVEMLRKYKIRTKAFLIVGLPGETERTIKETITWIEEAQPNDMDVTLFSPLPGSDIFKAPEEWGITFNYNGGPLWFKGKPGNYVSNVSTEELSSEQLVMFRDFIEKACKKPELLR